MLMLSTFPQLMVVEFEQYNWALSRCYLCQPGRLTVLASTGVCLQTREVNQQPTHFRFRGVPCHRLVDSPRNLADYGEWGGQWKWSLSYLVHLCTQLPSSISYITSLCSMLVIWAFSTFSYFPFNCSLECFPVFSLERQWPWYRLPNRCEACGTYWVGWPLHWWSWMGMWPLTVNPQSFLISNQELITCTFYLAQA
jgi:hypothetical protein